MSAEHSRPWFVSDRACDDYRETLTRQPGDGGDLEMLKLLISEEDAAELAAELYCWLIQYPAMDQTMSEETATHFYDLLTGNWRESLHSTS